jgi:hypothetical protein
MPLRLEPPVLFHDILLSIGIIGGYISKKLSRRVLVVLAGEKKIARRKERLSRRDHWGRVSAA